MECNRCPDPKWYIYVPNQIGGPMLLSCASDKSNRCPNLIFYTIRRRDIVLRAWNYPGVENFSCTDKLFCNAYSFSIPLVATVSSSSRCRGHTHDLNRGTEPYWSNFHHYNQPSFVLLCGIHFGAPIQFDYVYCVLEVFQTVTCQKALFVQNITLVHIRRLQVHVHHFPTFAKKSQQKYHIWG